METGERREGDGCPPPAHISSCCLLHVRPTTPPRKKTTQMFSLKTAKNLTSLSCVSPPGWSVFSEVAAGSVCGRISLVFIWSLLSFTHTLMLWWLCLTHTRSQTSELLAFKSKRTKAHAGLKPDFTSTDQIDEHLKMTLQEDLNSMAPGIIIQVRQRSEPAR